MENTNITSIDVGRAAIKIACSDSREQEQAIKHKLLQRGILSVAVDFGGEFNTIIPKIVERAMVAAQRQKLVASEHVGAGSVAGAIHDAISQISTKALGFNVGGKIGIARHNEHLCVAVYMGIGVLNLNEPSVGLAHRSLPFES